MINNEFTILYMIFSKMTFACLSQATALSKRVFHQTQNTFNRIQNTFITDEIHDQGEKFISDVKFQGKLLISYHFERKPCNSHHNSTIFQPIRRFVGRLLFQQ